MILSHYRYRYRKFFWHFIIYSVFVYLCIFLALHHMLCICVFVYLYFCICAFDTWEYQFVISLNNPLFKNRPHVGCFWHYLSLSLSKVFLALHHILCICVFVYISGTSSYALYLCICVFIFLYLHV